MSSYATPMHKRMGVFFIYMGRTDKYLNKPDGRPHRRKMDGTKYTDERTDWQSTPWGDAQLTHLPGVREWLREEAIAADKADLEMQLLAEYGPHDVESAWRYYKHWVLKRPISYPHAHADQHAQDWDKENWHGPGLHSAANTNGWMPRRSTHFDALPEPPSKRPPGGGAGVVGTQSSSAGGSVYGTAFDEKLLRRSRRFGHRLEGSRIPAKLVDDSGLSYTAQSRYESALGITSSDYVIGGAESGGRVVTTLWGGVYI